MFPIHRIDETRLCNSFKNNGLRILNPIVFFNNPIVRRNYGIENIEHNYEENVGYVITFYLNDTKKFFLKCIKYGI